ncbi:hypothetical protein BO78DRAFT_423382 [Aspergillus sclerotiicarbonarius CBS 121057]|uniref:Uncharacterized protein n=1 Tax=Aspergillus sclerotiicarbonarius (strain CBS 121057 / IBT 28362) TaxID=1448318 RepID=A0A319DWE8_ASPSB|nr:hypothetical protein BO78DRAFT_423382 [Aspergillus sclerotiicarbonarius CBS 121057]
MRWRVISKSLLVHPGDALILSWTQPFDVQFVCLRLPGTSGDIDKARTFYVSATLWVATTGTAASFDPNRARQTPRILAQFTNLLNVWETKMSPEMADDALDSIYAYLPPRPYSWPITRTRAWESHD